MKRNRGRSYPETSAGGLVLRNTRRAYNPRTNRVYLSAVKVALIGRTDRRGRLLWSLPKGHIEDYETVPMTAVREVREETGIEGEVIKHLGTIDYWFLSDGKRIHKTVHHYLLRFVGGELSNADAEITEVKWVSMKDLPAHLSYADERKLARRATGVVAAWIRSEYGSGDGVGESIQIEGEFPDDDILGDDLDEADLLEPAHDGAHAGGGQRSNGSSRRQGEHAHSDRSQGGRGQNGQDENGQGQSNHGSHNGGPRRNRRSRRRGGNKNANAASRNASKGGNNGATGRTAGAANSAAATGDGAASSQESANANNTGNAKSSGAANAANGTNGEPRKKRRRRGYRGRGGRGRRPSTGNPTNGTGSATAGTANTSAHASAHANAGTSSSTSPAQSS